MPAPDFQSGVAGFQTRENALFCHDRALALVRMPQLFLSCLGLASALPEILVPAGAISAMQVQQPLRCLFTGEALN